MSIAEEPVEIPYTALSAEALRNLVEDFVTRDGTDYGAVEKTLEAKAAALMRLLASGQAKIFYERTTGTTNIVAEHELR